MVVWMDGWTDGVLYQYMCQHGRKRGEGVKAYNEPNHVAL